MGTAFADESFELERLLALAIGFTGTVALWWCYFHRAERIGVELAERAEDAGAVGWWGTWTLTLMVLAVLVAVAVADTVHGDVPGADPVGVIRPDERASSARRIRTTAGLDDEGSADRSPSG